MLTMTFLVSTHRGLINTRGVDMGATGKTASCQVEGSLSTLGEIRRCSWLKTPWRGWKCRHHSPAVMLPVSPTVLLAETHFLRLLRTHLHCVVKPNASSTSLLSCTALPFECPWLFQCSQLVARTQKREQKCQCHSMYHWHWIF